MSIQTIATEMTRISGEIEALRTTLLEHSSMTEREKARLVDSLADLEDRLGRLKEAIKHGEGGS